MKITFWRIWYPAEHRLLILLDSNKAASHESDVFWRRSCSATVRSVWDWLMVGGPTHQQWRRLIMQPTAINIEFFNGANEHLRHFMQARQSRVGVGCNWLMRARQNVTIARSYCYRHIHHSHSYTAMPHALIHGASSMQANGETAPSSPRSQIMQI